MKTPQEIADGIVGMIRVAFLELNENMTVEGLAKHNENMKEAVESIAEAIQAERDVRPPKGHIVTDDGVVRKVLGTLPITADGCVVMPGIEVFHPQQDFSFHLEVMALHGDERQDDDYPLPEDCEYMGHYSYYERDTGYSTYESYDVRACYSTREAAEAAKKETT